MTIAACRMPWLNAVEDARLSRAPAMLPEGDGYLAALTNFRYLANALWTTDEAVARMSG